MNRIHYDSPLGKLLLESDGQYLTGLWINKVREDLTEVPDPVLKMTACWLDAYFQGQKLPPLPPMKPEGTAFQKLVWQQLLSIPWGQTGTYGQLSREVARLLGKEKMSAQAVGQAVGKNPISILIPCHRVVGSRGQLTGYASGLENKVLLLRQEGWRIHSDLILTTKE